MKDACKNCGYNPQNKEKDPLRYYKCAGSPGNHVIFEANLDLLQSIQNDSCSSSPSF